MIYVSYVKQSYGCQDVFRHAILNRSMPKSETEIKEIQALIAKGNKVDSFTLIAFTQLREN
jgi:hypothetical protein